MPSKVPIIFRYDDIWASDDPRRLVIEKSIVSVHNQYNVPLIIGVTPIKRVSGYYPSIDNQGPIANLSHDPIRLNMLKSVCTNRLFEIALHGCSHTDWNADNNIKSEFRWMSASKQSSMLMEGKAELENCLGIEIKAFIPPYNAYDMTTLHLLHNMGFSLISASISCIESDDPILSVIGWARSNELMDYLCVARVSRAFPPIVVVTHPEDFRESGSLKAVTSLDEYEKLIVNVVTDNKHFIVMSMHDFANSSNLPLLKRDHISLVNTAIRRIGVNNTASLLSLFSLNSITHIYAICRAATRIITFKRPKL